MFIKIEVKDNNVEQALRVLKRKLQRDGFFKIIKLKNTYENKGFIASLTPMIGLNDLSVIDYDTDKVQTVSNNFLSEFAAVNGKIIKEIV